MGSFQYSNIVIFTLLDFIIAFFCTSIFLFIPSSFSKNKQTKTKEKKQKKKPTSKLLRASCAFKMGWCPSWVTCPSNDVP